MERFGANAGLARAIVALLVINAVVVALLLPFLGLEPLSSEEGPMENFQALLLIAAGAIFLFAAWRAGGAARLAFYLLGLACLVMFLRELELPVSGPVTAYLHSKAFRTHEAIVTGLALVPALLLGWRHIPEMLRFALSPACWPLYVALLLLVGGEAADKLYRALLGPDLEQFVEEFFENCGFLILIAVAVFVLRKTSLDETAGRGV